MAYVGIHRKSPHFARNVLFGVIFAIWAIYASWAIVNNVPLRMIATVAPECATEYETGFCSWNAQTSGNGQGRSFVVIMDKTVYYDN